MAVQMICPNLLCRKFLSVSDDNRGKVVKCEHCQQNFRVPATPKEKTEAAPAGRK